MSSFADDYFNALFEFHPTYGTEVGFHQYDSRIEDLSAESFTRRIEKLKELRTRLAELRRGQLSSDDAIDGEILEARINAELLDLETLGTWRTNPMSYVGLPGGSIDGLLKRNFAPPAERLRSVIAQLERRATAAAGNARERPESSSRIYGSCVPNRARFRRVL